MTAFDFPSSPTEGQQYAPVGGPTYAYTDGKWITASEGIPTFPAPGYRFLRSVYFTTVGANTYTKPADVDAVRFRVQAGGAGGGGASGSASDNAAGAGGGGGSYTEKFITSPNAGYTLTVGGGGAGGAAGANNGVTGGGSTVDAILSAGPGVFGGAGTASATAVQFSTRGGGGSTVIGGDFNSPGSAGQSGYKLSTAVRLAGAGGDSYLGSGANESAANVITTSVTGAAGRGYGGGGAGGMSGSVSAHAAGGDGAQGIIIVDEYSRLSGAGTEVTPTAGAFKNILHNADGKMWQRGPSPTVTDDVYSIDRWYGLCQGASMALGSAGAPGISLIPYAGQLLATANRMGVAQIVEGKDCQHLRGKNVTLGGYLMSVNAASVIRYAILEWVGTENVVTSDVVLTWTSTTYTNNNFFIADANLVVRGVGSTSVPSGDTLTVMTPLTVTLGTTFNNLIVFLWTEAVAVQNQYFRYRPQLERGDVATEFEQVPLVIEWQRCLFYYERMSGYAGSFYGMGFAQTTTEGRTVTYFSPKRVQPTIPSAAFGNFQLQYGGTTATTCTSITFFAGSGNTTAHLLGTIASGLTAGGTVMLRALNTSAWIAFDAEL